MSFANSKKQPLCTELLGLKKRIYCQMLNFQICNFHTNNEITDTLEAQKYETISMIRSLLHKLINGIFNSRLTKMIKLKLNENLYDRYTGSILDLLPF